MGIGDVLLWAIILGFGGYAVLQFLRILAQIAMSFNEISVVLQEMLKDSRSGK
jgi:hypothetical protein